MGSRFSDELLNSLWESWKRGVSLEVVSGEVGRPLSSLYGVISKRGGVAPRPRRRSSRCLTAAQREEISRGLASGMSLRSIARFLGRAPSTISREVDRNGGRYEYRAARADRLAWKRAKRPKPCRLVLSEALRLAVAAKLQENWSPEQISGWLKLEHPDNPAMQVSTETIYRSLFVQSRGALKRELLDHLRSKRRLRRSTNGRAIHASRRKIAGAVSIRERPAEVEDRAIPGHWEGDLLAGARFSNIATLVERHSRFTMLVKVPSKHSHVVVTALARQVRKLPAELRRSLTWDQGVEMTQHAKFSVATDVQVYFCDPHSPWQRGSNENTNGLLRQYFPHGTDLSRYTQAQLNKVALSLNQRPRKTLGFRTPATTLEEALR